MLFPLIPLTSAWRRQRKIDSFIRTFIISTFSFESPECVPQDLEDFLGRIGDTEDIFHFLSTPYRRNKAPAYSGQTPFQMIVGNLPWNYIPAAREALNFDGLWGYLVQMQLPKTRLFLNRSDLANRLDLTLKNLPEVTRQLKVHELLIEAIETDCAFSIPALRHALFGDKDADQAKWAKALVEDRYIFTALSEGASSRIIKDLLSGLTPAQYREVMMAVDPENETDPIPLIMQAMLSEDWGVKEAIAERFEESDWENLLTGNWSKRFIKNVIEDKKADKLLSFILKYLSDDCILRVAQANDSLLLREIIFKEKPTLYDSLLNSIEDKGKKEHARTLLGQFIQRINTEYPTPSTGLMVPAFLLQGAFTPAAQKIVKSEGYEDLRCSYTCFEDLHFACFEDLASPAP